MLTELKQSFHFGSFNEETKKGKVYLRHDVDIFPENITKFLEIEMAVGVRSIFFLQPNNSFYNILSKEISEIIKSIINKGFEIGLHIDAALLYTHEEVSEETRKLYDFYAGYYPFSKIISLHRPQERNLDNLTIPGFINTYEERFFKNIRYFADSNRKPFYPNLIDSLRRDQSTSIQLNVHPFWWDYEHLSIESLLSRFIATKNNKTKIALASETKAFNDYFAGRML
jgi:hypothetical protein